MSLVLMKYTLIAVIFLGFMSQVFGQFHATARLDTTSMLIGDTMRLHLRAEMGSGWRVLDDGLSQLDSIKQIEKRNQTDWQQINGALEKTLTFTIYDSGYYWIPSLNITFEQGGQTTTAHSNSLALAVYYPKADSTLITIRDIVRTPFAWQDSLPYIALILGILAGILCFSWLINRRRNKQNQVVETVKPLTPDEAALLKLAELRRSARWQTDIKSYYSTLTYIIREYMEAALQIPALESTANDIIQKLPQLGISPTTQNDLKHLFTQADLAKFANHNPPENLHESFIDTAEQMINQTKPAPITPDQTDTVS